MSAAASSLFAGGRPAPFEERVSMAESIYVLGDDDRRKFAKIVANV
jgi:hypothetical protein